MALWARRWKRAVRHLAVALVVGSLGVTGCVKAKPSKAQKPADNEVSAIASDEKPGESTEEWLHQPFTKAVRQFDDPPADCNAPPPMTISGKSVYKIYKDVVAQWDGIRFVTTDGKRIHYSASIFTPLGQIDIELRPDLAPNHVRNFVALARAGYYDQLFFDRVNHEEYPDKPGVRLDHLEAGCPLGTGEEGYGSVGYWLLPEVQPPEKSTHVVGTVGACRGMEKDSAGCKFYITLCEAPFLDTHYTIFGKVTRGLDVAGKIFAQPVMLEDRDRFGCRRPERPVVMQKVIINTSAEDGAEGKK